MPLKLVGCLLLLLCTSGCGFLASWRLHRRVAQLEWYQRLLQALRCQLDYSLGEVDQLLLQLSQREELSSQGLLPAYLRQPAAVPFPQRWRGAVEQQQWELTNQETQLVLSLGETLGAYDLQSQQQALDALEARVQRQLQLAGEERDSRSRLYNTLGILLGLMLCLVLL